MVTPTGTAAEQCAAGTRAGLPGTAREVRLARTPDALPAEDDLWVVAAPPRPPGPGEVLVRNLCFHVSTAIRLLIAGAVRDTPFPPLRAGDTLVGAAVGEVAAAGEDAGLNEGDLVFHWYGWREYATVPTEQCDRIADPLPDPAAHLGQGWTAYAALTHGVDLRPGDTVLVTAASGAIGSMAGPLARLLGAGRVIGSTGSADKARRLTAELGYDAVVRRDGGDLAAQLAEAAPGGIDVCVDNTGGEQLSAAVRAANPGARFVLVGALAGQLDASGDGTAAPVELDSLRLIHQRITLRGFSADDVDPAERARWERRYAGWLRAGELTFAHTRVHGLDAAPRALTETLRGRHLGCVVADLTNRT
ncbi:MDR family NADP-dependent oxidoreductase [Actinomadura macrotermitis]|uniref:Putative NADP-dependent oxidoreductase YfmJ n=1 Tax=Actinomadura macrotermitis TaxID=2585200 RepID=A0A7K0BZD2_9ACTN|nr:NADP-dependent oxidoreductase [Actinomadura macrotermitis]MQY06446.1 putative NADP-dependent oxidoreductase YfmJ [Actinomadura macrotermitis]